MDIIATTASPEPSFGVSGRGRGDAVVVKEVLDTRTASSREDWKRISAESSIMSPRRPSRPMDRTELNHVTSPWLIVGQSIQPVAFGALLIGSRARHRPDNISAASHFGLNYSANHIRLPSTPAAASNAVIRSLNRSLRKTLQLDDLGTRHNRCGVRIRSD